MKAFWKNQVLAEAPQEELIRIEGNWYFPPTSLKTQFFTQSSLHTVCPWKGEASYYNVTVDDEENADAAWYYPEPKDGSVERVGRNFSNYVAFWHGVEVAEKN